MNEQEKEEICRYDLEYKNVVCTAVNWETKVFYFTIDKKEYKFLQKEYVDCNSDTDHIRYVIEYQFLPWLKEYNMQEEISRLTAENDKLRVKTNNEHQIAQGTKLYIIKDGKILEKEVADIVFALAQEEAEEGDLSCEYIGLNTMLNNFNKTIFINKNTAVKKLQNKKGDEI